MKTIIAGSRKITQNKYLLEAVKACGWTITKVVCGNCRGPDILGKLWARKEGIPRKIFKAKWQNEEGVFDRSAGFKRNVRMVDYAEALIAIWDGKSEGTKHTISLARKKGLKVYVHLVVPKPVKIRTKTLFDGLAMVVKPVVLNKHKPHKLNASAVYIGRGSEWGNRFVIGKDGTREQVIAKHKRKVANDPKLKKRIKRELKGKNLLCSCAPKACHGDYLLEVANDS